MNSTTVTSRREQAAEEEKRAESDVPGFFRVRRMELSDSVAEVVRKLF